MNYSEDKLIKTISQISPLYEEAMTEAQKLQDSLAKPPGSLGKLERLSV